MAFHGPSYGLSAELQAKRDATYDSKLEAEAIDWIKQLTGVDLPTGAQPLAVALNDGAVLCNFVNKIRPGSVKSINKGKMPFQKMENIGNFLAACAQLGVQKNDLFQTVDLYEVKNMSAVIQTLHALGRASRRVAGFNGPYIGVKESDPHKVAFSEEQMNRGKAELGLLTKGQMEHSMSGADRSRDVNKNYEQKW